MTSGIQAGKKIQTGRHAASAVLALLTLAVVVLPSAAHAIIAGSANPNHLGPDNPQPGDIFQQKLTLTNNSTLGSGVGVDANFLRAGVILSCANAGCSPADEQPGTK